MYRGTLMGTPDVMGIHDVKLHSDGKQISSTRVYTSILIAQEEL
ncbi:unnamed protein product [Staurois parvus]|uniref:Uncharacterized protein n=1 Tax=Staurois parvus TaxID=386267 RepID=A0ABN9APG3_9NEOB|nr:unnamed protein product [Staurois parvus]